jgi:PAS domain S-box-containing protein
MTAIRNENSGADNTGTDNEALKRLSPEKMSFRYQDRSFFALIENISDVVVVTDNHGAVCYASPSIQRVLGYVPHEVLQRNIFEFVHFEDTPSAKAAFEAILENPGVSGALTAVRARHRCGKWHNVEVVGKRLTEGETVVMSLRDITDRTSTEEALRQSETKLRMYFEQTKFAVIEWDENLEVVGWNPAAEKIFGYSAEEAKGRDVSFLVPYHLHDFARELGVWVHGNSQTCPLTNENVTRQGRVIACDWCNTPLTGSDGNVIGVISLVEDVTEQRRMQEHLAHAQRLELIGTMASGIAHDLNNILTPIVVIGPALRLEVASEMGLSKLDALESSAQRGLDLVNNILSFTRGLKIERTNVQTRKLFTEIGRIIEEVFPKSIRLKVNVPDDLWMVLGNATELHQVLMNLCINGRDAMPNGGTLTIGARNVVLSKMQANSITNVKPGPYVEWQVSDTGIGMTQETLSRIFDPFFTTKERGKGTGLGLAISQRIINSHSGAIQVDSQLNRGTDFKVYIPVCGAVDNDQGRHGIGK